MGQQRSFAEPVKHSPQYRISFHGTCIDAKCEMNLHIIYILICTLLIYGTARSVSTVHLHHYHWGGSKISTERLRTGLVDME